MSEDLDDIVENLREPSAWTRVVFMLGFAVVLYMVVIPLTLLLAVAQALFSVFTGEDNDNLRGFGASLLAYISQVVGFLTFNSDERPFPFSDFPEEYVAIEGAGTGKEEGKEEGKAKKEAQDKQAEADAPKESKQAAADKPAAKKASKRKSSSKKTTKKATKKAKKKTAKKTAKPATDQSSESGKTDEKTESEETKE